MPWRTSSESTGCARDWCHASSFRWHRSSATSGMSTPAEDLTPLAGWFQTVNATSMMQASKGTRRSGGSASEISGGARAVLDGSGVGGDAAGSRRRGWGLPDGGPLLAEGVGRGPAASAGPAPGAAALWPSGRRSPAAWRGERRSPPSQAGWGALPPRCPGSSGVTRRRAGTGRSEPTGWPEPGPGVHDPGSWPATSGSARRSRKA